MRGRSSRPVRAWKREDRVDSQPLRSLDVPRRRDWARIVDEDGLRFGRTLRQLPCEQSSVPSSSSVGL